MSSALISLRGRRSRISGRLPGISWSSTRRTGYGTSTRIRARSRWRSNKPSLHSPKSCTATPLQNSLLELYWLVSIIDDFAFGDLQSYRSRFARLGNDTDFAELKERLAPLCKRTLRRQVLKYVKFTNRHIESQNVLDRFNERLWRLTRYLLRDHARFEDAGYSFVLHTNPFAGAAIHPGPYRMGKRSDNANTYRVGHPLAQRVLALGRRLDTPPMEVAFRYRESGKKIAVIEPLLDVSGWLTCARLTVTAMETEDHLFFAGVTDTGELLDGAQCRRLFDLPATVQRSCAVPEAVGTTLAEARGRRQRDLLEELTSRNGRWFDLEMDKLDRWAEDRRASLKEALGELDEALKAAKKAARLAPTLPEKLERQREARVLEGKRDEAWRAFDQASREIDRRKDGLLDEISRRLEQKLEQEPLFTLRWRVS